MKTCRKDNLNLFELIKTAYNKRVASETEVANWQLKVMVYGERIWIAFDRWKEVEGGKTTFLKTFLAMSSMI